MKIEEILFAVVIILGVFLASFGFVYDMSLDTDYNITIADDTNATAQELIGELNDTTNELEESLTGANSWEQTLYSIFFKLPNTVTSGVSTFSNIVAKVVGFAMGAQGEVGGIPAPQWLNLVILTLIGIGVTFAVIRLVLGRDG